MIKYWVLLNLFNKNKISYYKEILKQFIKKIYSYNILYNVNIIVI